MTSGIRGRVAIAGMGCSQAGWRYGCSQEDLIVEAGVAALVDAGLDASDIQASWFGCTTVSANHALLNFSLKLGYTAMTKVSNAGATGADALRNACIAVASGAYDIVLAAGVEKPRDSGYSDFFEGDVLSTGPSAVGSEAVVGEFRSPVHTSFYLTRYAAVNQTPAEDLRQALTHIVLKNRRNGARNPLAGLQAPLEEADVEDAGLSVWPLTVADTCTALDGSAAAVICTPEVARRLGREYVVWEGMGAASGGLEGRFLQTYDYTGIPEVQIAAGRAYATAGISDPLDEVDHLQLFDITSASELLAYEDLGLAPKGQAVRFALDGVFDAEGKLPSNTDGGLLSNGYQAGATGIRQIYESYLQLLGRAGPRQLPSVRRSLVHTLGGGVGSFTATVQVLGKDS